MQITGSDIYWLTRLDILKDVAIACGFIAVISALASIVMYCVKAWSAGILTEGADPSSFDKAGANWARTAAPTLLKLFVPICCLSFVLWVGLGLFVPTTKEYAAIKVVPVVLNNTVLSETAKEDFGELYELSMTWAKEELKAATPEVREAVTKAVKETVTKEVSDTVKTLNPLSEK